MEVGKINKYIHYGHKYFDIAAFEPIKNMHSMTKPRGGLWASSVKAKFGWKEWNDENEFRECNSEYSFVFTLNSGAKVLTINKSSDLIDLPRGENKWGMLSWVTLDFEKLKEEYDAIEVNISSDDKLYWDLYGWDCDSILVMNPDVVIEMKEED